MKLVTFKSYDGEVSLNPRYIIKIVPLERGRTKIIHEGGTTFTEERCWDVRKKLEDAAS